MNKVLEVFQRLLEMRSEEEKENKILLYEKLKNIPWIPCSFVQPIGALY